jgi:hypothetical protein
MSAQVSIYELFNCTARMLRDEEVINLRIQACSLILMKLPVPNPPRLHRIRRPKSKEAACAVRLAQVMGAHVFILRLCSKVISPTFNISEGRMRYTRMVKVLSSPWWRQWSAHAKV